MIFPEAIKLGGTLVFFALVAWARDARYAMFPSSLPRRTPSFTNGRQRGEVLRDEPSNGWELRQCG